MVDTMPDARGGSMVQKHRDKLQKEKEAALLQSLRPVLPHLPAAVLRLAAQEGQWELEPTVAILELFQTACQQQLRELAESAPLAAESSESSSGADTDSEEKAKASRKKSKHKSKRKHKSKEPKQKKRSRREPEPEPLSITDQYGKYGVIRESDMYNKHPEFALWAADVKKIDVGLLPKLEEKELFRSFIEDFNTGTLPHRKYYDREVYEARRAEKAAKKGAAAGLERTAFDDESERKRELVAERAQEQNERMREAYNQLKYTERDKMDDMREQDLLRQQMRLAYRTGDQDRANKIMDRLRPDEDKEKLTQRMFEEGGQPLA